MGSNPDQDSMRYIVQASPGMNLTPVRVSWSGLLNLYTGFTAIFPFPFLFLNIWGKSSDKGALINIKVTKIMKLYEAIVARLYKEGVGV